MITKLKGKSVGGTRLGFIALVFSALFFTSSLEVYREETQASKDYDEASKHIKLAIQAFASTSEPALTLAALSACESSSHDKTRKADLTGACDLYHGNQQAQESTLTALNLYEETLRSLGSSTKVNKKGSYYFVHFATHGLVGTSGTDIKIPVNSSVEDYSSDRLFLESQRQSGELSPEQYAAAVNQLAVTYLERFSPLEQINNEQSLNLKLDSAEQQLTKLQDRVRSLEKQLAKAERTPFEKWCPIVISLLTALIALSANFVAWRTDRRQTREAELLPLKRQELEQKVIQNDQQIQETKGVIITPTREELVRYSETNTSDRYIYGK
jgi:hypothetical protein